MTKGEMIKSIRNRIFGDRESLQEAYDYVLTVAEGSNNKAAVLTAVHVMMNTIANELEKGKQK